MPTTTTVQMFYIGNFAEMDTNESDTDNEAPGIVQGTHDDLSLVQITEFDQNDNGAIYDDEGNTGDTIGYDTGAGPVTQELDSSSLYNADILLGDGSILSVPVVVLQAANGDVFVTETSSNPLDNLSIQSITLLNVVSSAYNGYTADRYSVENASVVCYGMGVLIDTPDGPRRVETLRPGDLVSTLDHGPQAVLWARVSDHPLDGVDCDKRPVLIRAGALGPGRPVRDMIVSPQHRILVGDPEQLGWMAEGQAFAPAKALTPLPGIRFMRGKSGISYVHFACARHEVVMANGCLSESLLLGPMVMNGLSRKERADLRALFVTQSAEGGALNGPAARPCLTVGEVARRIRRYAVQARLRHATGIGKRDGGAPGTAMTEAQISGRGASQRVA